MTTDRLRWLLVGVAAIVLVLHAFAYNFITDDAYISFVYSRNFAEHGELVFNLGDYVEGYTNFLWTLLIGLGMLVHIPPEWSAKILGALFAVLTLWVTFVVVERALGRKTLWATVPPLLLACSAGFACWTSGGLETQLFTMLCTIAIEGLVGAEQEDGASGLYRAAVALALAAMTRPEGMLIAAALGVVRIICNVSSKRGLLGKTELVAAICFLVLWAPWFAWRWNYYGYPFPNTYYVKATGDWASPEMARQMREAGMYYVWIWLKQTKLVFALPLVFIGLVGARPRTPRFALGLSCALIAAFYIPYTISVGGDFMGLHRFIMPLFVVAAIAVVLGLELLCSLIPESARKYVALALGLALVGMFAGTQLQLTQKSLAWGNFNPDHGIDTPAFLITYTEDRALIGQAMQPCFKPDDFSIVGGAGAQPYYGRMQAIDVFGLVSDRVAHREKRIRPRAGHTKFASDALLAEYEPTFIFSCYAIHPTPARPTTLNCNTGFWLSRGYEMVTMHVPGMKQSGEYYTFLAKKDRNFECPGRVP
ncbi:MAG TPA: glycosyltransferase family 39 protein [Kofleriaceae bacterium]|nr:glycosyltransferase family 39 protein [Kofleriaceae bacterium]